MEIQSSHWSVPSLTRHKTAILALTALALGYSLHYIHDQLRSSANLSKPSLRRSNARRQRRRPTSRSQEPVHVSANFARYVVDTPWGSTSIDLDFLGNPTANAEVLAQHDFRSSTGQSISIPLARHLPSSSDLLRVTGDLEEAETLRRELELGFLTFYFCRHMSPSPVTSEQQDILISELRRDGDFSRRNVSTAIMLHQEGQLMQSIERWTHEQRGVLVRNHESQPSRQGTATDQTDMTTGLAQARETTMNDESEHSWRGQNETDDGKEAGKEGQSLLNLLYRIAEERARKDGYVHRRVTCNSCNMMPIRGIRYHCANCLDYDLCEQCEAMEIHPKTHLFYKIRIPAPFIRNPRQPEPLWYPGKPATVTYTIENMTSICKETGYQAAEVEALWEQFRCLAATEWLDDPGNYCLAIDRQTFNKCFMPQTSHRPSPPNLIYDRMFSFYDTDGNELIGFQEFIHGLASLTKRIPGARQKRLFQGYDINNDGYVDRKDFLRVFRAYYSLTRELTRDVLASMEDDVSENGAREIVLGSQPISSAFTSAIPQAELPRARQGKVQDRFGDDRVPDGMRAIDPMEHDFEDPDEILADAAEMAKYGYLIRKHGTNCSPLYSDPWPPRGILEADIEKVLAPAINAAEVTLPEDQKAIRRAVHARVAKNHQRHSFTRRQAVRDRQQRRAFYLDSEDKAARNTSKSNGHDSATVAQIDAMRIKNLQCLVEVDQTEAFYDVVREKIVELDWPVYDSPLELAREIGGLVLLGWKGVEIAEDLSAHAMDLQISIDFVDSISDSLQKMVRQLGYNISVEDEIPMKEPLDSFTSSRRSRSSSKVRFQDEVESGDGHKFRSRATSTSSRSVPTNERWGSSDMPEPEEDIGREVLYQVTQEAFNELLDPIFRLREDLALAALQTRRLRDRHRADIVAAVDWPIILKRDLDSFQRWWRTEPFQEIVIQEDGLFEGDEAAAFLAFLVQRETGEHSSLSCEKCSRCAGKGDDAWIYIGYYCVECGLPSRIAREVRDEAPNDELCPACDDNGEEIHFDHGSNLCNFGHPSPHSVRTSAWIKDVISGRFSQRSSQDVAVDEEGTTDGDAYQGLNSDPQPQAALDLDSSVAVFDEAADPSSLTEHIARKPLDELLADSGYTFTIPPPDPTLPQNRPNEVSSPNVPPTRNEPPTTTTIQPPDPTLPQNRPNTATETIYATNSDHTLLQEPTQVNNPPNNPPTPPPPTKAQETPPDRNTLLYYAALDIIEAEDRERGGPGRLSFKEWEQVMNGEKGKALAFLGTWLEMATF